VAIRLGASMPLYYQWYHKTKRVGEKFKIDLDCGDIYIMEEKAVGTDWKFRNSYTLRHAAGCNQYIKNKIPHISLVLYEGFYFL
jgi:hypothetical protein